MCRITMEYTSYNKGICIIYQFKLNAFANPLEKKCILEIKIIRQK